MGFEVIFRTISSSSELGADEREEESESAMVAAEKSPVVDVEDGKVLRQNHGVQNISFGPDSGLQGKELDPKRN